MTSPTASLRIAASSDVHMHLAGWDALRDATLDSKGMDRLASVIRDARQGATGGFVLLDNGDTLQGTPLGDMCVDAPDAHPWPAILHALGYDAMGLGNHDFDFGLPYLEQVVAQIHCPVLCANVSAGAVTGAVPTALLDRMVPCSDGRNRSLRLGLTSVLPPQTGVWNRRCLDGTVGFTGGVNAARQSVAALHEAGADIVVILCHSGLTHGLDSTGENFGAAIAAEVPGVDAMILGHTHLRFPGPDHTRFDGVDSALGTLHGVPAVMPAHAAQELGVIDLNLSLNAAGWSVKSHSVERRAIGPETPRDPTVNRITAPLIDRTRAHLDNGLGHSAQHMHSWFSMLRPSPPEMLVARSLSNTIQKTVADTDLAALPLLASVAPAALGGRAGAGNFVDIPPGPFRERHIAMLCPYPNTVWAAVLTGAELWDWVDRGLAYFGPGADDNAALVNSDAPGFNFDSVHGIEAEVDPFAPAAFDVNGHRVRQSATRVRRLTRDGRDVHLQERFLLAMTSYRGAGAGNFPGMGPHTRTVRTDVELRDALRAEVRRSDPSMANSTTQAWRFVSAGTQRRVIHTAPAAEPFLSDVAMFDPHPMGIDNSGFLRVQVSI